MWGNRESTRGSDDRIKPTPGSRDGEINYDQILFLAIAFKWILAREKSKNALKEANPVIHWLTWTKNLGKITSKRRLGLSGSGLLHYGQTIAKR